jgi:uncharacterized protein YecE (DUF72 family)
MLVGTSGWQYADWRGPVYPRELPQRLWLEHYASLFPTVEVNNAFYRLPERSTFERWRERTPPDFVVAVKVSRYLTHIKRLQDPSEPVSRFLDRAAGLGPKLGPALLQLPPTLRADAALLDAALAAFHEACRNGNGKHSPSSVRVVVEPRHPSWFSESIRAVLTDHRAALCWADRRGRPQTPLWRTADFGYLRLHEGTASPRPRYGRQALRSWRDRLSSAFPDGEDVFVYFNNDHGAAAVINAHELVSLADQDRGDHDVTADISARS